MENKNKVAHLRQVIGKKQCELLFRLTTTEEIFGVNIDEDICAVRSIRESVHSVLKHLNNKIAKIIVDKRLLLGMTDPIKVNIPLSISCNGTRLKGGIFFENLLNHQKSYIFHVFDMQYSILVNTPFVENLLLPEVIYANFSVQPVKFKADYAQYDLTVYNWYKSIDKKTWTQVGDKYSYWVDEDDVDHYLKFVIIPKNKYISGTTVEEISKSKVQIITSLPRCPFESRHVYTKERLKNNKLRIVSYNTLASRYSETNEQFPYCAPEFLSIDYRKQLISKEILGYKADVICLQEVDSRQYSTYFKNELKDEGFGSVYHKKGFRIPEGLVCAYKKDRFTLVVSSQIVYAIEAQRNTSSSFGKLLKRDLCVKGQFLSQSTSLQITILKHKILKKDIIVANTHLYYRPDATIIRLLQITMAMQIIEDLKSERIKAGNDVHVILCGDLNSTPKSPVVSFLLNGRYDEDENISKVYPDGLPIFHSLNLESACGFPKYTNYTHDFKDCLDYVFIEKDKACVTRNIPLPSEEELAQYEGLPNQFYPSDHLANVVDVKIT